MVVGRGAGRVFLDDPREWNRSVADIGGRSWTPMVHRQTLAMAVALGRTRAGRVRRLFVSELAHLRRSTRISKNAQGTFSHVVLLAVDWNYRCIPQSPAQSQSSRNRRHPGTHLYCGWLCMRARDLVQTSTDLLVVHIWRLHALGCCYF